MSRQRSRRWAYLRKFLTLAFFVLVVSLLYVRFQKIDWGDVRESLQAIRMPVLLGAAALTALSYSLHSCYDLIARHYVGHRLPVPRTVAIAMVSYSFNMSLGGLIGGMGFRFRLYSRFGLKTGQISRILGMSVLTNWLGYVLLAGAIFSLRRLDLPDGWAIGETALQLIGLIFLLAILVYLWLCFFAQQRTWVIRRVHLKLPSGRLALLQLAVSVTSWTVIASLLSLLLPDIPFPALLAVLMVSSTAGALAHVPAGLGVMEAVFLAFFAGQVPEGRLLAGLIAYRAVYYLLPLLLGALAFLALELRARRQRRQGAAPQEPGRYEHGAAR